MNHTRQIEQFGPLVNLSPESLFQILLCSLKCLGIFKCVQMGKNTHNPRKSMNLTNIEELKNLHLKSKTGVHQQKNKVSHLGNINHGVDVIGTFYQGQSP